MTATIGARCLVVTDITCSPNECCYQNAFRSRAVRYDDKRIDQTAGFPFRWIDLHNGLDRRVGLRNPPADRPLTCSTPRRRRRPGCRWACSGTGGALAMLATILRPGVCITFCPREAGRGYHGEPGYAFSQRDGGDAGNASAPCQGT